ncbi:hypothetical protein [Bradyrhizobium sp. CCBAU 65884]|uniref:hypothetical protein n=1 Tax=Bradyrhizobium sp. CCBAU 65884 TaxID=722477 RepID=UPI002306BEC1|nr:hypothetical protein [Bradyrhizobium sp. CCBAU 65884]
MKAALEAWDRGEQASFIKTPYSKLMIPKLWPRRSLGQKSLPHMRRARLAAHHSLLLSTASELRRRFAPSAIDKAIFSGNAFGSAFST